MWWRKKRETEFAQTVANAVAQAVVEALKHAKPTPEAQAGEFFSNALSGMSGFLNGAGDLALRGAASALGQRGGRKTAAKRQRQAAEQSRLARPAPQCPLCRDPHFKHVTVEMIQNHRRHEGVSPTSANPGFNVEQASEPESGDQPIQGVFPGVNGAGGAGH